MKNSKLLKIIRVLTSQELKDLDKLLQTSYFGTIKQRPQVLNLFHYLQKRSPDFSEEAALDKKVVFQSIFPNMPYQADKIDRVLNQLMEAVKRFVLFESIKDYDEVDQLNIQARFYRKKTLNSFFQSTVKKAKAIQQQRQQVNKDIYLQQYQTAVEISEFNGIYNLRIDDLNLPNTLQQLDLFFVVAKLEYTCSLLAQARFHFQSNSWIKKEEIMDLFRMIDRNEYLQVPIIIVYRQVFQVLYDDDSEVLFKELLPLIDLYAEEIAFDQLRAIQSICRGYCIQRYNKGDESYLHLAFKLYRNHLEGGFLYHSGGILPATIKNLLSIGLKLGDFDWVKQFLDQHQNRIIGTTQPEAIYNFNLANYYFAIKDYEQAIDFLPDNFEDLYYKITSRRLEIKLYYEITSPLLESKIQAFNTYLFRVSKKLLSPQARVGNNNFIKLLRQIYNPSTLYNEKRIQRILTKIDNIPMVAEREWLIEKLGDLR